MSEDSLLPAKSLKVRINRLFDVFTILERKNSVLSEEVEALKGRMKELERAHAEITDKYNNLKLAKGLESGLGDSRAARQKINKLVREIDKCVALLNE